MTLWILLGLLVLVVLAFALVGFLYMTRGVHVRRVRASGTPGGAPPLRDPFFCEAIALLTRTSLVGGHRVDVALTDRITQLLGVVRDAKGRTVMGADVLVFPEDAPRWTPGARSVKRVRADAFGRFQIDALVPGDYLAIALDEPVPFALDDTQLMQQFGASATRVRISDGERRAISLRVTSRH